MESNCLTLTECFLQINPRITVSPTLKFFFAFSSHVIPSGVRSAVDRTSLLSFAAR